MVVSQIKKVVIVGPLPLPAGGMANQTLQLSKFLAEQAIDVDIVRVNSDYKPAWVAKLPVIRAFFRLLFYIVSLFKQLKSADVVHIMANSGWSWHLFAAPAIMIARLYNRPVVINYRGGYAQDFFDKSWFWVHLTLKHVQQIVVPSPFLQEVFGRFQQHAVVVPNVLNHTLFNPKNRCLSADSPHIIVTRNLEAIYDVTTAINAFALVAKQVDNVRLSIAGTGPEQAMLETLVKQLGLSKQVTFTGRLSPAQIANLYKSADVMINTSVIDNTPNSIIESLACGTPVVSTNVGGIPKLVNHQLDAFLVEVGDAEQIATHVLTLLNDEVCREQMVATGLKTIEKFYWHNVWQLLEACYQDAIKSFNK